MKPQIKSIKELEHQIALGTAQLGPNIPSNIGINTKTRRLAVDANIHRILRRAVELDGTIPRTEISKVASTSVSSVHIAHAEVLGLIKRLCPYENRNGRRISFVITKTGRQALKVFNNGGKPRSFVKVDVKINLEAFVFHANRCW